MVLSSVVYEVMRCLFFNLEAILRLVIVSTISAPTFDDINFLLTPYTLTSVCIFYILFSIH